MLDALCKYSLGVVLALGFRLLLFRLWVSSSLFFYQLTNKQLISSIEKK